MRRLTSLLHAGNPSREDLSYLGAAYDELALPEAFGTPHMSHEQ